MCFSNKLFPFNLAETFEPIERNVLTTNKATDLTANPSMHGEPIGKHPSNGRNYVTDYMTTGGASAEGFFVVPPRGPIGVLPSPIPAHR